MRMPFSLLWRRHSARRAESRNSRDSHRRQTVGAGVGDAQEICSGHLFGCPAASGVYTRLHRRFPPPPPSPSPSPLSSRQPRPCVSPPAHSRPRLPTDLLSHPLPRPPTRGRTIEQSQTPPMNLRTHIRISWRESPKPAVLDEPSSPPVRHVRRLFEPSPWSEERVPVRRLPKYNLPPCTSSPVRPRPRPQCARGGGGYS
ncbi:hypothetical protein C8Q77DRAFT_864262 [Trametes polyzona]|nr:hypothetical protein C8Q77DRAFT_864262 [Trametes polyzona]